MRGLLWSGACLGFLLCSGCGDGAASADDREERDPHVINGRELIEDGRYADAIVVYKKAIANDQTMARPHLEIALTYQRLIASARADGGDVEKFVDHHVHSIYHFDRYLELRPDAEKAEFIKEQKLKVVESLAVFLINRSPTVREVVEERNLLVREQADLKRQLAAALNNPSASPAPTAGQSVTQTIPKTTKSTESKPAAKPASQTQHQIYHVVAGDTLTKIANQFYQDSGKWDVIFNANRDTMKSSNDLKVGQTLVIPALGN